MGDATDQFMFFESSEDPCGPRQAHTTSILARTQHCCRLICSQVPHFYCKRSLIIHPKSLRGASQMAPTVIRHHHNYRESSKQETHKWSFCRQHWEGGPSRFVEAVWPCNKIRWPTPKGFRLYRLPSARRYFCVSKYPFERLPASKTLAHEDLIQTTPHCANFLLAGNLFFNWWAFNNTVSHLLSKIHL